MEEKRMKKEKRTAGQTAPKRVRALAGAHSPETAPKVHPVFNTLLAAMRGDFFGK
jgi:hypothetical protein